MRSIYVPVSPEDLAKLQRLAESEYRDYKSMAAILIRDGLRRAELAEKKRAAR